MTYTTTLRAPALPLALTMGEPAGIGGEITLSAWHALSASGGPAFVLIDDPARIEALAAELGMAIPIARVDAPEDAAAAFARALPVLPLTKQVPLALGSATPATASAVLESIETAVALASTGRVGAVVTNPIHKAVLKSAGFAHPGHTEYLAALARVPRTVMMLACEELRVVPVTVHIALNEVSSALDEESIVATARIVDAALKRDFAMPRPRLAVAGLNPHAGEAGHMGSEDEAVIAPRSRRCVPRGSTRADRSPPIRCSTARRERPTTRRCACTTTRR